MLVLAEEAARPAGLSGLIAELTSCSASSRFDRFFDRLRVLRFGQLGAGLRFEGQRVAAVGLFGQVVFEQFGRHGRAGARAGSGCRWSCRRRPGRRRRATTASDQPDGDRRVVMPRAEAADRVEGRRSPRNHPLPCGVRRRAAALRRSRRPRAPIRQVGAERLAQDDQVLGLVGGDRGGERLRRRRRELGRRPRGSGSAAALVEFVGEERGSRASVFTSPSSRVLRLRLRPRRRGRASPWSSRRRVPAPGRGAAAAAARVSGPRSSGTAAAVGVDQGQLLADGDVEDLGVGLLFGRFAAALPALAAAGEERRHGEDRRAQSRRRRAARMIRFCEHGSYCQPMSLERRGLGDWRPRSTPAGAARAWSSGARRAAADPPRRYRGLLGAAADRLRRPGAGSGGRRESRQRVARARSHSWRDNTIEQRVRKLQGARRLRRDRPPWRSRLR